MRGQERRRFWWGLVVWTLPMTAIAVVLALTVGQALMTEKGLAALDTGDLALVYGTLLLTIGLRAVYRRKFDPIQRFDTKSYNAYWFLWWTANALIQWPWNDAWGIAVAIMAFGCAVEYLLRLLEDLGFSSLFSPLVAWLGITLFLGAAGGNLPQLIITLGKHDVNLWRVGEILSLAFALMFLFELIRLFWCSVTNEGAEGPARGAVPGRANLPLGRASLPKI